jgi:ABC-type transport system involved in multi-copper enzyme maturation permease subunit
MALPLLKKELLELAGSRRTYALRVVFAASLFAVFGLVVLTLIADASRSFASFLGVGRNVFHTLVLIQIVAVYVFQPLLAADAFPHERERGSLDLLWLAGLSAGELVVQKYLSRVLAMVGLMLITLPALAYCRALGGVTTGDLWWAFSMSILSCLHVGAFTVMFSARTDTTGQALVATYVFLIAFYVAAMFSTLPLFLATGTPFVLCFFCPPATLFAALGAKAMPIGAFAALALPTAATVPVGLVLARRFLRSGSRRSFRWPRLHGGVERRFQRIYQRLRLSPNLRGLPERRPIAWREAGRPSVLRPTALRAHTLAVVVAVLLAAATFSIWIWVLVLWVVAVVYVIHRASTAMVAERSSRTLEVLLTTPLTRSEIVRQKLHGVLRTIATLALLFLVMFVADVITHRITRPWGRIRGMPAGPYLALSFATVAIQLPMFGWFALWIGMQRATAARASAIALVTAFIWVLAPLLLAGGLMSVFPDGSDVLGLVYLLSPGWIVGVTELGVRPIGIRPDLQWLLTLGWHLVLLFVFRAAAILRGRRLGEVR